MKIIRYVDSSGTIKFAGGDSLETMREIRGDIFGPHELTPIKADVMKLLAPIAPTAFMCIGLNYRRHAEETKAKIPQFPVLFMKSPGAVQNPNDPIQLPTKLRSDQVDYECELAVVIGRQCKNVKREDSLKYVLGYTCANDVSSRDWQKDFGGS